MATSPRTPLHIGTTHGRERAAGSACHRVAGSGGRRPPPPPDSNVTLHHLGMRLREMYAPFVEEPLPDHLAEFIKRLS